MPVWSPLPAMCGFRPQIGATPSALCAVRARSEEHTSELQSRLHLVCRLLLEKKMVTSLPLIKERILVIILLLHFLSLMLGIFFFNDTATTEIYTLSLHDALPISVVERPCPCGRRCRRCAAFAHRLAQRRAHCAQCGRDRKSTRLNSSHGYISYAVFCLKKKW